MRAYQFKVALMHDKKTYRNIAILGNQTLDDLHESIFDAFDRVDPHLYSFFLTRKKLSNKRKIYQAPEYTLTAAMEDFDMASSGDKFDAENKTIEALQLKEKEAIYYLFDFGDEWWHELTLIAIQEADPSGEYPTIVKKAGESPEQYPDYHGEM